MDSSVVARVTSNLQVGVSSPRPFEVATQGEENNKDMFFKYNSASCFNGHLNSKRLVTANKGNSHNR